MTESLDLFLTHGLTCTLPSCQILWTRSKRSLAWARKQAEINKYGFVCVFFFFFFFLTGRKRRRAVDRRETCSSHTREDRKLSAGENLPSLFTSQGDLDRSPSLARPPTPSPALHRHHPHPHPHPHPPATEGGPGRSGHGLLSPCSEMSLGKPL